MQPSNPLAAHWQLDPHCVYLNHGSFGPSPIPVQAARARWSEQLERQPMRFFCGDMETELDRTAAVLARFLKTQPDRIALIDNATFAMNVVAASINLSPDDEVLLTDHEYGAVKNIWQDRCRQSKARVTNAVLPFPPSDDAVVAAIEAAITSRTRLIVVSHVTSATACILPVKAICQMAARHKVPVCVDGPHAIAMLDVNLNDLGCDYYCASCHKWLCAPFGSGFLWVHPRHHSSIRCPVVSWGGSIAGRAASWKDRTNWLGTRDPAPLLAISDAIEFFNAETLAAYRQHAHSLVSYARRELLRIPGSGVFCTPNESDFVSMAAIELPQTNGWKPGYHGHPDALQIALRDQYQIELLMGSWNNRRFLRVSAHLYTTMADMETLIRGVNALIGVDSVHKDHG
jgi:isopenicillin-N epimerase